MVNKPKAKGTRLESDVTRWLRLNGFPGADRQPLRGNRDAGDIAACPGIVVETKNYSGPAALGQPPRDVLAAWLHQCEVECRNAGADFCPLVTKRKGTQDPGRYFAYLPARDVVRLIGTCADWQGLPDYHAGAPVCFDVETLFTLLRLRGYGSPWWVTDERSAVTHAPEEAS